MLLCVHTEAGRLGRRKSRHVCVVRSASVPAAAERRGHNEDPEFCRARDCRRPKRALESFRSNARVQVRHVLLRALTPWSRVGTRRLFINKLLTCMQPVFEKRPPLCACIGKVLTFAAPAPYESRSLTAGTQANDSSFCSRGTCNLSRLTTSHSISSNPLAYAASAVTINILGGTDHPDEVTQTAFSTSPRGRMHCSTGCRLTDAATTASMHQ